MTTPHILTDTSPLLDPDRPTMARAVITDAWGLYFAQGGVVMAAALRAMGLVLARDDLGLASASATFCRPVVCGPVETEVRVLRSGRRGAQVQGSLRDETASEGEVSVAVSAVFTDPALPGPVVTPLPRPTELLSPPPADADRAEAAMGNEYPLGFLDNTEWQVAAEPSAEEPLPRLAAWFRFRNPPAAPGAEWNPALLPIPGDSLGSALVVALGGGDTPVGSVSLQIDLQVHAPVRGTWIGIDSTCTHVGNGLASGVLHLWTETGDHVATVTQTAMLRSLV
jgi:acyl-CoA thioesterase